MLGSLLIGSGFLQERTAKWISQERMACGLKKIIFDILRGLLIGVANIIPGVSGGTMMVSMGIYDTLIYCITHLFKQFKKSVATLLPYAAGMALAIVGLSFVMEWLFESYPLPTNTAFIGLILGGLPVILKRLKGKRTGLPGGALFGLFFALIVVLQLAGGSGADTQITLSVMEIIKLFAIGVIASATMVIPGVSGSMILMLLGYYNPVINAVSGLVKALAAGSWAAVMNGVGILLPFGIGIVVGIFAIAKLIEVLIAKWEGWTYCAILGLVAASPVAILIATPMSGVTWITVIMSLLTFAIGFYVAYALAGNEKKDLA